MRPKASSSSALGIEEQAIIVAFRNHKLPRSTIDCALWDTIPHLTRSSLHRCLQRHGISRLPEIKGDKPDKKKFKPYPFGFFHINIAEIGGKASSFRGDRRPRGAGRCLMGTTRRHFTDECEREAVAREQRSGP
jgi:hypothetical protein